jgi:LPXTG-site transpeptidase (sortase) family protein
MAPTSTPVLTLITCYPYMIDTHRLVVIAELAR